MGEMEERWGSYGLWGSYDLGCYRKAMEDLGKLGELWGSWRAMKEPRELYESYEGAGGVMNELWGCHRGAMRHNLIETQRCCFSCYFLKFTNKNSYLGYKENPSKTLFLQHFISYNKLFLSKKFEQLKNGWKSSKQ